MNRSSRACTSCLGPRLTWLVIRAKPQTLDARPNDPHIDEICRALKLNVVACEYYGVHLMKSIQSAPRPPNACLIRAPCFVLHDDSARGSVWVCARAKRCGAGGSRKVNLNKLRAEYATQMRKRKEFEGKMDERRR
eukprot:124335-Rhodomonas_salina.1